jgi:hypothetical protein
MVPWYIVTPEAGTVAGPFKLRCLAQAEAERRYDCRGPLSKVRAGWWSFRPWRTLERKPVWLVRADVRCSMLNPTHTRPALISA